MAIKDHYNPKNLDPYFDKIHDQVLAGTYVSTTIDYAKIIKLLFGIAGIYLGGTGIYEYTQGTETLSMLCVDVGTIILSLIVFIQIFKEKN